MERRVANSPNLLVLSNSRSVVSQNKIILSLAIQHKPSALKMMKMKMMKMKMMKMKMMKMMKIKMMKMKMKMKINEDDEDDEDDKDDEIDENDED